MTGVTVIIHSARLVSGSAVTADAWVAFAGDTVSIVGTGTSWREVVASAGSVAACDVVDAQGRWLTPGFIDIHCHGAGGAAFDDGAEGIRTALAVHRAHGTTRSVLSLVTARLADLEERLDVIATAADRDPLILGAHLEGPFLDDGFRGAHDRTQLRAADAATTEQLLLASRGYLRQITLAPELSGGLDAVRRFAAEGVVVAVGHSAADYATARAAFDAGASVLTHAFNAMHGIHHRAPGPVVAAMSSAGVTLELINDGVHVHPEVVRLAFAGAPGRVALVTDAMAATGFGDGTYWLGSLRVMVTDGVARLAGGGADPGGAAAGGGASALGAIAGSTLTLDAALQRAVQVVGLSVAEAVTALTETPARAIGRAHDLGQLAPGFTADAVLLSDDFEVEAVFAAGQRL